MANDIFKDGIPAIIEAADRGRGPDTIDVGELLGITAPMLMRPVAGGGFVVESIKAEIDKYRAAPERRKGTANLTTLASFVLHVQMFMDADSAIFINDSLEDPSKGPYFLAVLNYNEAVNPSDADAGKALPLKAGDPPVEMILTEARRAAPRFGDHRSFYKPEFSDEWTHWNDADGVALTQKDFAALIEKGARDIFDVADDHPEKLGELGAWFAARFGRKLSAAEFYGSSGKMLEMADGLTATIEDVIGDIDIRGAVKSVSFTSKTSTGSVEVPTAFLLSLPVFKGGPLWQVPARLKLTSRPSGDTKRLEWTVDLYAPERTVKAALDDMGTTVRAATGLPVFVGSPE